MKISFIKHSQLDESILLEIINLKNQHWKFSIDQHKQWIKMNLVCEDYHLLLKDDENNLIAYLNLISVKITTEGKKEILALGVGNVCVEITQEKTGMGLLLIHIANYFIKNNNMQGLLLCKESLEGFYKKAGWTTFEGQLLFKETNVHGKLMSLFPISYKFLSINKIF